MFTNISAQEAYSFLKRYKNNPDFMVIDVRTAPEYMEERIDDALNLDLYSDSFEKKIGELDKNKEYLLYCESGNRSEIAAQMMARLGFVKVNNLEGGILAWQDGGLPLKK